MAALVERYQGVVLTAMLRRIVVECRESFGVCGQEVTVQFSLKSMMITLVIIACTCSVFFALPNLLSICIISVAALTCPALFIGGIVYGRRYGRAFSIGATIGATVCSWFLVFSDYSYVLSPTYSNGYAPDVPSFKLVAATALLICSLSGAACVGLRWASLYFDDIENTVGQSPLRSLATNDQVAASRRPWTDDSESSRSKEMHDGKSSATNVA